MKDALDQFIRYTDVSCLSLEDLLLLIWLS